MDDDLSSGRRQLPCIIGNTIALEEPHDHLKEITAGGIAGMTGILATQPMDTIRVRLQSGNFQGIYSCLRSTLQGEGIRGLYKGVASPTLTVGLMNAVLFFSYEFSLRQLRGSATATEPTLTNVAVAGSFSGLVSAFVTGPTELVKCIAQTTVNSKGQMKEEWEILRRMIRTSGWFGAHGPTRGLSLTILRDCPSFGLYFVVYEAIIARFGKSANVSFYAGGFAGVSAWGSIYPIDVIKTRWSTAPPGAYMSIQHCLSHTVANEGVSSLFKGFGATMLRAWPQNAMIFFTYEGVRGMM